MILYQSTSVTIVGQFYHSVKSNVTNAVILAEIDVAPTNWTATNIPQFHEIVYDSVDKEFIFKHQSSSTITLTEGKYSIGLNITVGSENISLVFVIYVVKDYRVEEHVFEKQFLTGYLHEESRVLSDCTLSIIVCEKDSEAYYRRYTYTNEIGQAIDAIAVVPKKTVSIDDVDGVKHQEYSVELQPTFPIQHVFERFIALQNQAFVDGVTNEDTLFAYLRLVDVNNESLCEGIIDTQDGRFQFQYETELQTVVRTNELGQSATLPYRVSNAITLQLYSPSTLLKAIPVVDNVSKKITYAPYSDGIGFADYLYNEFIVNPFTIAQKNKSFKILDVIERFAKYINRQSILAKTGILQSTNESIEVYGYNQLCAITLSVDVVPPFNTRIVTINDVIDLDLLLFNFILSDVFGEGEQANGEKRSFNVERTRGLRNADGRFPRRDSENDYSFLLMKNAEEILNALTLATAYLPAFEVITESAGAGNYKRYKLRTLLTRPMNTGEKKGNISNIVEIDKAQQTLNVVTGGEIDIQNNVIRQFDQVSAGRLRYSEINGYGQEYKGGINDGFYNRNEVEIRNQNEVRAVGATNLDIDDTLVFASKRKTTFQIFALNPIAGNQLSKIVLGGRNVPIFYAVILNDYIRFTSYYAEALLFYQSLRLALLRREIVENVQLNHVADVERINEATVLLTNLLSDDDTMRFYKVLDADIDLVSRSAVLKLERVKPPFVKYNFNTDTNKVIEVKYDSAFIRWHGVIPRRLVTPFNATAYPSYPTNLPFSNFTPDEKKEFTLVNYASGSGLFGDAYEGVNVLWRNFNNPKLTLTQFINNVRNVLKNQVSVANDGNLYDTLTSRERGNMYKINARYIVEVKDADGGRLAGFDVAKGCLVVRGKPQNQSGVGVRFLRFTDSANSFITMTGIDNNYKLYVESIFKYKGRFCLFGFLATGFNFVTVEFYERYVKISPLIGFAEFLVFDENFKTEDEIHFEIFIDHMYGNIANYQLTMRINGVNYTRSDLVSLPPYNSNLTVPLSTSVIACVDKETSYVCMKLFRAFARNSSNSWDRLCDLSFNGIGASNADEPYASLPTTQQTEFIEYTNTSITNVVATENISIQPETAFNLPQT